MGRNVFILTLLIALILLFSENLCGINLLVGAESVEQYTRCGCSSGNLSFTNNQASKFINKIDNYYTRKFWYTDQNAWNSDLVEDQLGMGGTDYPFGDDVHLLFISGNGSLGEDTYNGYLCKSPYYNYCAFSTKNCYLGELPGQAYAINPGNLRFLILSTCHSVDKNKAPIVWGPVFWRGQNFSYVMGYSGTAADSWTTDEVGEDFARKAAGSDWSLKQAWFWAIEDFWINDTGSLISRGGTENEAIKNRDHMKLNTWPLSSTNPNWVAWSWHSG